VKWRRLIWATLCTVDDVDRAQVLMKDIVTPVPQEEVRNVIKKCLENAALVNYTKVSEMTKIEGRPKIYVEYSTNTVSTSAPCIAILLYCDT